MWEVRQTEQEAKKLLIEQLDSSLLNHAAALGQKEGGPGIVDVYKLQGLAELHYYLKAEHEFTAAEVDALLQFIDPLTVAEACWEENTHKHSFPICELLEKAEAYQRFPLKASDSPAQSQEELVEAVKALMDQEMAEYHASLLTLDKEELIRKSVEIASMQAALEFMKYDYTFYKGDAEVLLQMKKPLGFVASTWPTETGILLDMSDVISETLETIKDEQRKSTAMLQSHARTDKPSVHEQLQTALQEVNRHPPQEDKSKGGDAR